MAPHQEEPQSPVPTKTNELSDLEKAAAVLAARGDRDHADSPRGSFVTIQDPAILDFFDPEAQWPTLHYGDTIALIPADVNGIMAYSNSFDGRAWVEVLEETASMPPNLRDCHYRIMPRGQYAEAKKLTKFMKEGTWDDGRNLPLPEPPGPDVDLLVAATRLAKKENLQNVKLVKEMLHRVQKAAEEIQAVRSERQKMTGMMVHYLDAVELIHVSTSRTLTLTKNVAHELSAKKVMFTDKTSLMSIFVLSPAFKSFSAGEAVTSGDLVVFQSQKRIGGMAYHLHLGTNHKQRVSEVIKRGLQVSNPIVQNAYEVNATTGNQRPTPFRMVLFESYIHSPLASTRLRENSALRLRAEQMICFYHKESEAYLDYRHDLGVRPVFRESHRMGMKSRKKASWMWKLESLEVYDAGRYVKCNEGTFYRIKHVITNKYLINNNGQIELTDNYLEEGATFSLRAFAKDQNGDGVNNMGLVSVRTEEGQFLQQIPWLAEDDEKMEEAAGDASKAHAEFSRRASHDKDMPGLDPVKESLVGLSQSELLSERDGLVVMPIPPEFIISVFKIRRSAIALQTFADVISDVPEKATDTKTISRLASAADYAIGRGHPPRELPSEGIEVLRRVHNGFDFIMATLNLLVLNSTFDEDDDPMSRDGPPNRLMQKLLRELNVIGVVMNLVQLPFTRGIELNWMTSNDSRLRRLKIVMSMCYRLMKQTVKGNERNAEELHKHVDVLRKHQGKGLSATVVLKEVYMDKRKLLAMIQPDLVRQFTDLLKEWKDPRYIDFLLNITTCENEPMPKIQKMICDYIFADSPEMLPRIKIVPKKAGVPNTKLLVGFVDEKGHQSVFDTATFNDTKTVGGRDLASHIMSAELDALDESQRMFRYFIRCCALFSKVSFGRNQTSLKFLLMHPNLDFQYENILAVIKEDVIPTVTRARFTQLMIRLYLDRDPQASSPQLQYARTWSRVSPEESDLKEIEAVNAGSMIPVCTTGFVDLCEHILNSFGRVAGAKDRAGKPSLNNGPTMGQMDLISAEVELCEILIDYGFFNPPTAAAAAAEEKKMGLAGAGRRNSENRFATSFRSVTSFGGSPDFSKVKVLFTAAFSIVDSRGVVAIPAKRKEALRLVELRSQALKLMIRMLDIRANFRISVLLDAWEEIFEDMYLKDMVVEGKNPRGRKPTFVGLKLAQAGDGPKEVDLKALGDRFEPYREIFNQCMQRCYKQQIVSSDELKADTYAPGEYASDPLVEAMIGLMGFQDANLTAQACALMMRHMAQRTRVSNDLKLVQVMVYPAAVKVYGETLYVIKALTALRKHLFADKQAAYQEAGDLLRRMTHYLTPASDNLVEVVKANQHMMLDRGLHSPVIDILRLSLERDTSRRAALHDTAEKDADSAKNPRRRDLFQECYNFLKTLCCNEPEAQSKMFPLIQTFADHVGIAKLNVVDTIAEIVRDNPRLISQVPQSLLSHFIDSITIWGRKARWLRIFEVFLEIGGFSFKRNQDLVIKLVMDNFEELIDLECDYRNSRFLPHSDERYGKTRLELIWAGDHKDETRTLVKYHYSSVNLLALLAAGKNAANQGKIMQKVTLDTIIDQIISVPLSKDGKRVPVGTRGFDYDGVYYVRRAWTKLMGNVYLSSLDTHAIAQFQNTRRLWVWEAGVGKKGGKKEGDVDTARVRWKEAIAAVTTPGKIGFQGDTSLMQEWLVDIKDLTTRFQGLTQPPPNGFLAGLKDDVGLDMEQHVTYVAEILSALVKLIPRPDIFDNTDKEQLDMAIKMRDAVEGLFYQLNRLKRIKDTMLVLEVLTEFGNRNISGAALAIQEGDDEEAAAEAQRSKETHFLAGWQDFKMYLCHSYLHVDPSPGKSMHRSIKDLAMMLGSKTTFRNANYEVLREFVKQLSFENCDGMVQLNGLKVVRAILYLQPNRAEWHNDIREKELARMLQNESPSEADHGTPEFKEIQALISDLGGVDLMIGSIGAPENDTILAALMLATTMLEGGNESVQQKFVEMLSPGTSQKFFLNLHKVMEAGVAALKEQKKKLKQQIAEQQALAAAGIKSKKAQPIQLGPSVQYMSEVMKMMGQNSMHNPGLQDLLRGQRHNKVSINFYGATVTYLVMLEPELEQAINEGDQLTVQSAIRGFWMLAEAMRGPNLQNQAVIAQKDLFDLIDRLMNKIHFELPGLGKKHDDDDDEPKKVVNILLPLRVKNTMRSEIKTAVIKCLLAFLEGVEGDEIPKHLLNTVNFPALAKQMSECFQAVTAKMMQQKSASSLLRTSRNGPEDLGDIKVLQEEGMLYFYLLKFLKSYDEDNKAIVPAWAPFPRAVKFFQSRTGYVEIQREGRLERIYYPLPDSCIPGGPLDTSHYEMYRTERGDVDRKNEQYLSNMIRLVKREDHRARVRNSALAFTAIHFDHICSATFLLAAATHLILLIGSHTPSWNKAKTDAHFALHEFDGHGLTPVDIWLRTKIPEEAIAMGLTFALAVMMTIRTFSFVVAELPNLIRDRKAAFKILEADERAMAHPDPDEVLIEEEEVPEDERWPDVLLPTKPEERKKIEVSEADKDKSKVDKSSDVWASRFMILRKRIFVTSVIASTPSVWYELGMLVSVIAACVIFEPSLTFWPLFEMCFWKGSRTAIDAISFNAGKLSQTFMLGIAAMYGWMLMGAWVLYDEHKEEYCVTMFQCFVSYFYEALRGNGLKDVLVPETFAHNIVDFTMEPGNMLFRSIWDMSFMFIFSYVLIAIINGIVIDAFTGLRKDTEDAETELQARCFVCDLARTKLDNLGGGFDQHVLTEHNPRWYFFFLLHIKTSLKSKLTNPENYVLEKVWPSGATQQRTYRWFPREQTLSIVKADEDDTPTGRAIKRLGDRVDNRILETERRIHAVHDAVHKICRAMDINSVMKSGTMTPSQMYRGGLKSGQHTPSNYGNGGGGSQLSAIGGGGGGGGRRRRQKPGSLSRAGSGGPI